ncbi:unnamed protein product [Sphenostylis stenocarpa]|uniref:MICOS complex subunit MIC10 n=1 Tax=Sphenostylis stenocarpa TaxID=92480 RepID=A0AA86SNS0_9FABA|nr:unnamed protein product [Sphenostylis stenocarpa]
MADKQIIPPKHDLDAKWDACLDLTVRRFVYSSSAGAFADLLFFGSPVTRWTSIAFGAGVGIGSAYTECSRLFDGPPTKLPLHNVSETASQLRRLRSELRMSKKRLGTEAKLVKLQATFDKQMTKQPNFN